ncbi:hypothetical protein K440DRAFT_584514 [Wilcoxina mikolae CBS 423.85]|nr:hypothetical protein K440DRAFT_584514 [Wilcoxina mikolae CBS 423.85]
MAVPFAQQTYQYPVHQPQGQHIPPGNPVPVQRSQSLGNSPLPAAQRGPYDMGSTHRALSASGVQQLHIPQAYVPPPHPPPPPPQMLLSTRQPPSKQRFQTGASDAAVAYQLKSQQMQHYQGGAPALDVYTTYQQSATFYDPYGQPYTAFVQDPQGVPVPYSSSYPPPSYPVDVAAGTLPIPWYHPHPQQQVPGGIPYGYYQPANYIQQPSPIPLGPMAQLYHGAPDHSRRHSVPLRTPSMIRGPENEVMDHSGVNYALSVPRNFVDGVNNLANFSNTPSPQPSSPSIPRGPPRKPKQSGNALWVGNLPPATDVAALKDYFSSQARDDIESVFLISKSNCAFVNYRTEAACNDAMTRFHNSKFRGTRLVCRPRPRKGSTLSQGIEDPATATEVSGQGSGEEDSNTVDGSAEERDISPESSTKATPPTGPASSKAPRVNARYRYFILKSLTVEDLEMSVKNGVWATQSHNETVLNQAFESAEDVYLIFSANKSGEYYGYARMESKITSNATDTIAWTPPTQQSQTDAELPKAIYTTATETAPKGRIIDDSARGTIFWEALSDDEVKSDSGKAEGESEEAASGKAVSKAWGKPFKVKWISTSRVPFYRTRGIRNNLNSGREVKVARDGTELEESAGRRLVQMFHPRSAPAGTHHSPVPMSDFSCLSSGVVIHQ